MTRTVRILFIRNVISRSRPAVPRSLRAGRPGVLGNFGGGVVGWLLPALDPAMIPFVCSQGTVSKSIIWYHLVSSGLSWSRQVSPHAPSACHKRFITSGPLVIRMIRPAVRAHRYRRREVGRVRGLSQANRFQHSLCIPL